MSAATGIPARASESDAPQASATVPGSPLFTLRPAEPRDLSSLQAICEESGLGRIEDVANCTVAVDADDAPVGFIHIEHVEDADKPAGDGAWVYPVAVFESWQHRGVATALVEYELARTGELRLVACRPSRGFYPRAGFRPLAWSRVATRIGNDCKRCVARRACDPKPYVRTRPL
jgi:GNAT superfamily N-acetyltransferase